MSWEVTLLDASFKSVKFDVIDVSDDVSRDVQSHYYPYVDGADQEDLGRQARQVSMTAVFWGTFYEFQVSSLLKVLNEKGAGELIHPVFGVFPQMQLQSYKIAHTAENVDYCTITMTFIEHQDSNPFFALGDALQELDVLGFNASELLNDAMDIFNTAMSYYRTVVGTIERIYGLRNLFTSVLGALSGSLLGSLFNGGSDNGGSDDWRVITSTADVIAMPKAFIADMQAVFTSQVDKISKKGDADAVIQSDWGGIVGLADQSMTAVHNLPEGGLLPDDKHLVEAIVGIVVLTSVIQKAKDILTLAQQDKRLTALQVERILNDSRALIDKVIEQQRTAYDVDTSRQLTEPLKTMAWQLQKIAMSILEARPPLIKYTVQADMNLHLLAHHLYNDYSRADEILRLNNCVRNPNFIAKGEVLNVYAE